VLLVKLGEVDVNSFKIGKEELPSLPVTVLSTGAFRNNCGSGLILCNAEVKAESISGRRCASFQDCVYG